MKNKGKLLFWSISDIQTTKEELERLGFERYIPRNDFKSAMVKTLKEITKGNDKLYRRFHDEGDTCSFAVFEQTTTTEDIKLNKQITLRISKTHGNLEIIKSDVSAIFEKNIKERYAQHKDTIDSAQFRAAVLKAVRAECWAVGMRPGGGIYFVDDRFEKNLKPIRKIFEAFPAHTKLHEVPVYDDRGTVEALQEATAAELFADIEELTRDIDRRFKSGLITTRQIQGDKEKAGRIMEKLGIYKDHLRSEALKVSAKLNRVRMALDGVTSKVEREHVDPNDFSKMLESL